VVTYVLDASSVLRYLDMGAGAKRVAEILKGGVAGRNRVIISAIQWGEVAGILCKRYGEEAVYPALSGLQAFGVEIVPATAERAVRSGMIKVQMRIPYADAFGVDLTADSSDNVFVTADFDFEPAKQIVAIEYLPLNSSPN
jgi:predicted nucleic acid-binding protein